MRNYLNGVLGDQMNAIFAGAGYNFRKLIRELFFYIFIMIKYSCQSKNRLQYFYLSGHNNSSPD